MATHNQKLEWWGDRICGIGRIDVEFLGRSPVRIQPEMVAAVDALEAVFLAHEYPMPTSYTGSYSCRKISGSDTWSLHAVPIAIDVDYPNNPVLPYELERGFDTDPGCFITEAIVDDVEAIVNENGDSIWKWLGWRSGTADPMHFEIDVPPDACQPAAGGCPWRPSADAGAPWRTSYPSCSSHFADGEIEWGKNTGVCNVPDYALDAVAWAIGEGMINVKDTNRDDFDRNLTDGRYWTFEYRANR